MQLVPSPALYKVDVETHTCHPSTGDVDAGGSGVEGHSWLHNELEASLGYIRLCLKTTINN